MSAPHPNPFVAPEGNQTAMPATVGELVDRAAAEDAVKPCPGCLRITEHDHMPGNRTFPGQLWCRDCHHASHDERENDL